MPPWPHPRQSIPQAASQPNSSQSTGVFRRKGSSAEERALHPPKRAPRNSNTIKGVRHPTAELPVHSRTGTSANEQPEFPTTAQCHLLSGGDLPNLQIAGPRLSGPRFCFLIRSPLACERPYRVSRPEPNAAQAARAAHGEIQNLLGHRNPPRARGIHRPRGGPVARGKAGRAPSGAHRSGFCLGGGG
jgi:hypothetical protein